MKKLALGVLALFAVSSVFAAEPNLDLLKSGLNPGAQIQQVKPSVIPGFYEVLVSGRIIYLSENGEIVISGDIYDLKKKVSYTEVAKSSLRKTALDGIKDEDKIIYKAKDEKYKVTVFTDISCPYCSKLHEEMNDFNDAGITVEYLAFPRGGVGSKSQKDMQSIWCADDKTAALTAAKISSKLPDESCEGNQVVEQFLLGKDMGISATPTMVFSDGALQAGYIKSDGLVKLLQEKFPN